MMETTFDLLRAKVEAEVSHPAVVAITSATDEDGRDVAARALAASLAAAGYSTLLVDTCNETSATSRTVVEFSFDELARQEIAPESTSTPAVVSIRESLQRKTNKRLIKAAFDEFREKFDYIIISTGFHGSSNAFAANAVIAADIVLVSVKIGRRQTFEDARLAAELKGLGAPFLGLISMSQSPMDVATSTHSLTPAYTTEANQAPVTAIQQKIVRRKIAERPRYKISRVIDAVLISAKTSRWQRFLGITSIDHSPTSTTAATHAFEPVDITDARPAPMSLPIEKAIGHRDSGRWPRYAIFGGSASVVVLAWLLVEASSR